MSDPATDFLKHIIDKTDYGDDLFTNRESGITILTGAGISAESGIQTFRGSDGLWCGHHIEDVATPQGFAVDPDLVHNFYNERRRALLSTDIKPNAAHEALARLEREWPGRVTIVTQNIDNLHERAGSENVFHMHGELLRGLCALCQKTADVRADMSAQDACPSCGAKGHMRPDIVWFGEMPYRMEEIEEHLLSSAIFLSIGTSGHVYPAAGFVTTANQIGAYSIELNLEPSRNAGLFTEGYYGPAGQVVPEFVEKLLGHARAETKGSA